MASHFHGEKRSFEISALVISFYLRVVSPDSDDWLIVSIVRHASTTAIYPIVSE